MWQKVEAMVLCDYNTKPSQSTLRTNVQIKKDGEKEKKERRKRQKVSSVFRFTPQLIASLDR